MASSLSLAVYIVGLVLASVFLVGKVLVNAIVGAGIGPVLNVTGDISSDNPSEITPAGWAFSIWGVIYTWQFIWVIYAWSFVCRPNTPRTIFTGVYFGYVIICILNTTWIFVWGNAHLTASAVILVVYNLVFYPTIACLAFFLNRAEEAKVYDLWLTRILALNGLLFYATWTTIASLLNLTLALQHEGDTNANSAAYVALSLLLPTLLTYFVLENLVFDRYLRYAFAVYPVVIWALSASLAENWNTGDPTGPNIFTLVLLLLAILLTIIRVIIFVVFTFLRPLRPKNVVV